MKLKYKIGDTFRVNKRIDYLSKSPIEGDTIEIVGLCQEMNWYLCGTRNSRGWDGKEKGIFNNRNIVLSDNAKYYNKFWYVEDIEIDMNCERIEFYEIEI